MACSINFCGPKCSLCCTILSAWAVIMLPIMGLLLHIHSITFAEDLLHEEGIDNKTMEEIVELAETKYEAAATTCFYATAIYVGSFVLSAWQFYLNRRNNRPIM